MSVPTYDVVVIGSGFGGSITALRAAQAGKRVLVLERGRRYRPGEFPRDVRDTNSLFWRYPVSSAAQGLFELRCFSGLGAVVASGVGGGSLIYANIHVRPHPSIFDDPRWPAGLNRSTLDPYYDKVAAMLRLSPLPPLPELAKRHYYRRAAAASGRAIFDPEQAVSWTDPAEPNREACRGCASCEFGCQYGSKNTLDFNYLAAAEALGAVVQPRAWVSHVEAVGDGYRVQLRDLANDAPATVVGRRAIVAAGTLGTVELLLRSRDVQRTLPNLSRRLGDGYSGNGDFLGVVRNSRFDLEPWVGPDVTSVMVDAAEPPRFTMAAQTFNRAVMTALASMPVRNGKALRFLAPLVWPWLERAVPLAFRLGLVDRLSRRPNAAAAYMTNLFGIGLDNANGRMRLRRGRLDIDWAFEAENGLLIQRMSKAMQDVADVYGGSFAPVPTWSAFRRIFTVHSLGGCRLAASPEHGVVSADGEVFGYPGLFVADGSVIPTAIGFHPVMTIAAVAERIAERVVANCG